MQTTTRIKPYKPRPCLKSPHPSSERFDSHHPDCDSSALPSGRRKCVAWCGDDVVEVHEADVWDRTPTQPSHPLTIREVMELEAIQRSLPRANQLPDPWTGKRVAHYLSTVPVGLLPLLPADDDIHGRHIPNSPPITSPPKSPSPSSPLSSSPLQSPLDSPVTTTFRFPSDEPSKNPPNTSVARTATWHPAHLAHLLPSKPILPRARGRLSFLPLLDTPPNSLDVTPHPTPSAGMSPTLTPVDQDQLTTPPPELETVSPGSPEDQPPPTPKASLSIETAPPPKPDFIFLPPRAAHIQAMASPSLAPPSPLLLSGVSTPALAVAGSGSRLGLGGAMTSLKHQLSLVSSERSPESESTPPTTSDIKPKKKKKTVMVINDIEIELDDDEDDEAEEENAASDHELCSSGRASPLPEDDALSITRSYADSSCTSESELDTDYPQTPSPPGSPLSMSPPTSHMSLSPSPSTSPATPSPVKNSSGFRSAKAQKNAEAKMRNELVNPVCADQAFWRMQYNRYQPS